MDDTQTPTKRRKREGLPAWVPVVAILAFLALAAGGYYYAQQPKDGVRVEQVEADARAKLKLGESTREDAKAWFASKGYNQYGEVMDTGGNKIGYRTLVPNDTWMEKWELDITFTFDRNDKLNNITVARFKAR